MPEFECFCGDAFASRNDLMQHNVEEHNMPMSESRQKVLEKYPES